MEKTYQLDNRKRKELCKVIAATLNHSVKYLGPPTFAYQIGDIQVNKDATVKNLTEEVHQAILAAGFTELASTQEPTQPSQPTPDKPNRQGKHLNLNDFPLSIAMPLMEEYDLQKLDNLLVAKGDLIQKALQADRVSFSIEGDRIKFDWFDGTPDEERLKATMVLIEKLIQHAKERKRISRKVTKTDNEKYTFRTFLLSLGMIGPEYKEVRKTLMKPLNGDSSFRKPKEKTDA